MGYKSMYQRDQMPNITIRRPKVEDRDELHDRCTNSKLMHLVEVGTVFVRPDYQKQGVGNLLLNAMYQALKDKGIEEFCLDSGYPGAQKIWLKKFGTPDYFLENYWGENLHHMIWRITLGNININ